MIGIDVVDLGNPRTHRRHLDQRFLNRIFSPVEQELILASATPNRTLWHLWAMKEAAFKAIGSRLHPEPPPVFTHPDFRTALEGDALTGRVVWRDREVRTWLHIAGEGTGDAGPGDAGRGEAGAAGNGPRWCSATARLTATSEGEVAPRPDYRVASVGSVADAAGGGPDRDPREMLSPREVASVHSRASALVRLAARASLAAAAGMAPERLQIVAGDHPGGRIPPVVLLDGVASDELQVTLSHDGPWIAWGWRVGGV